MLASGCLLFESSLQRWSIPSRQVRGCFVRGLQEVQQRLIRIGRLAHDVVRQDEFVEVGAVEGLIGTDARLSESAGSA